MTNALDQVSEYMNNKQFEEASSYIQQQLDLLNKDQELYGDLLHKLVEVKFYTGNLDEAKEVASEEIQIKENLGISGKSLAGAYQSRGVVNQISKNYEKAREDYRKALEIAVKSEVDYGLLDGICYSFAGLNQHYLGNYELSYELYDRARDLAVKQKNEARTAFFLIHMGMSLISQKKFEDAERTITEGIELYEKIVKEDETKQMGAMFAKLERVKLESARGNFQASIEFLTPLMGDVLSNQDPYARIDTYLIISNALQSNQLSTKQLEFLKQHLETPLDPNKLVDQAIIWAEESHNTKFMVFSYVEKAKLIESEKNIWIAKAKQLLEEDPVGPAQEFLNEIV